MPTSPTYPGVYIEEISSGVRTIVGVATSITAFIGRAQRGPVNEPTTINGFADFERMFGGLWNESRLGFAVRDFFLNGGGQAVIVRLFNPTFASFEDQEKARAAAQAVATAAANVVGDTTQLDEAKAKAVNDAAKAKADEYNAKSALEKAAAQAILAAVNSAAKKDAKTGDVVKAINDAVDNVKAAAQAVATAAANVAGDKSLGEAKAKDINDKAKAKAEEYKDKSEVEKAAAQAMLTTVNATATKEANADTVVGAINEGVNGAAPAAKARLTVGKKNQLQLEAAYEGKWGNNLRARVDYERPYELPTSFEAFGIGETHLFNLTVRDMKTGSTEVFRNVTVKPGPRTVDKTLENESKLVRVVSKPDDIPENSDAALTKQEKGTIPLFSNKRSVEVTIKASDGVQLTGNSFTGPGMEGEGKGLYALEKLFARDGLFNLLCIPPYKFDIPSGDVETDLLEKAAAYCEKRRAMLLIDPPSSWKTKTDARDNFVGAGSQEYPSIRSKNAAIFFPRLIQANPLRDNQMEEFVPCGAVAGIFARTDVQRGVWKAPAGIEATLVGVPKLSVPMTNEENGELNPLGINCLRAFPATGRIVWGSRTLRGADQLADEWKYIPVRRTALFIEESLYRGTQWVVFEPNDEPLWAQIRLNVGAFMQNMFRQGAFQGTTPREAYFVKCDKETTIQNDINLGIVNIVVGFAPLKPAEFVIIKLQQMAGQIEV